MSKLYSNTQRNRGTETWASGGAPQPEQDTGGMNEADGLRVTDPKGDLKVRAECANGSIKWQGLVGQSDHKQEAKTTKIPKQWRRWKTGIKRARLGGAEWPQKSCGALKRSPLESAWGRGDGWRHWTGTGRLDRIKYSVMYPGQVIHSEFSRPSNPQGSITLKGRISSCRKTLPIDEMVILYDLQLTPWEQSKHKMHVAFPCFPPTCPVPPKRERVCYYLLASQ